MTSDLELLQNLTESDVDIRFNPDVLTAARRLFRAGNVHAPVREGTLIAAQVRGEDGFYYEPAVAVIDGWVRAMCDCESPDYCPHIGALLLNWVHACDDFASDSDAIAPDFLDYVQELIVALEDEQPIDPADSELVAGAKLLRQGDTQALEALTSQTVEQELRDLLAEQTVRQLRAIARRRGWTLGGTRKDGLVNQLVQFYLDAPDTADVVEALEDDRRLAVEYLALRASAIPVPENVAQSAIRRLRGRRSEEEAAAILQDLQELGLVFAGKEYGETTYCMPAAVVRHVPPWPELLASFAGDLAKLDVRQSPAFALTQVAYQVWQYLDETPVPKKARTLPKPTQLERQWSPFQGWLNPTDELAEMEQMGGRFWSSAWQQNISVQFLPPALSDADLSELRQRTGVTDAILDFAFNLLTSLNLIRWEYGDEIRTDEKAMLAFLTYPDVDRLRVLTFTWMRLNWWSEMALVLQHVEHLRLRRSLLPMDLTYSTLMEELAQARMVIVTLLARLSPGTWYRAADLRQLLHRIWPDYLHARSLSLDRWWLETAGSDYKLLPGKAGDWEVGYAPFITACLEGPLAWLGVVTLAYDRRGLAAFQLGDLGAYLLGLHERYVGEESEPAGPALVVHGDGTVIARTGFATTGAYDVLNVAARLEETSAQEFHYRVTADSIQRAFDQGWTGQAILDELDKHSLEPVPDPLRSHILDWAEGYGQVHLYEEVTLVEFADDFALQELLASTSLARHLVYQFSPRLVAIQAEAVEALRDELVRQGHTPRVE